MHSLRRFVKFSVSLVVMALVFVASSASVSALSIAPTADSGSGLLFGQYHRYSVTLRGNGEAILYARLAFPNNGETSLTQTIMTIPGEISELAIYQQVLPPECVRYGNTSECEEYRDPDYSQSYYYSTGATYTKLTSTNEGETYTVNLATPIEPSESGAIILGYSSKSYVTNQMGLLNFDIETIQVPSRITELSVAVDVDSDLILKGKKATVDYGPTSVSDAKLGASPAAVSSRELDSLASSIGSYGALNKTAKNLAANESYHVRGQYAASWWRLYLASMIWTLLIIGGLIAGIAWLIRRNHRAAGGSERVDRQAPSVAVGRFFQLQHVLYGLLSIALVSIAAIVFHLLSEQSLFGPMYYSDPIISMASLLLIVLIYILALFGPAIYVATTEGWRGFAAVLVSEVLWCIVLLMIYLVLYQTGLSPAQWWGYPTPVSVMEQAVGN